MKLNSIMEQVDKTHHKKVAVAQAADEGILKAVQLALDSNLAHFQLFGDESTITNLAQSISLDINREELEVIHVSDVEATPTEAVKAVSSGNADVVMKGNIDTKTLLKAVLNKEYGLRTKNVLSHVALFEIPNQDRLILLTDSGMNLEPNLEEKAQIISNAVQVARAIGVELPKVAPLAAVEVVNPTMQPTVDAASLTQMQRRGQIKNCVVDGPLAFDNAVSLEAAQQKGIESEVAGKADILLAPSIEVANALYKSFIYFSNAKVAGVINGAKSPIVLTSRADSAESKLYSLALALLTSERS
ncbi:phosphate butyryltransferase [Pontibacillus yanchengensis]|uniref:Phosphate butyryltransferase n=1 Tax=Pontibacillus yanchengensis Y32 TaxID=1385514 RepID=A0A0A2T655_9BACI|nr:phosphate butyryltransferase [Pontibacillus yanchengensis]KGP71282.1 phosphate butyryltransferase [Pontibacillus yanchengensis Y32]